MRLSRYQTFTEEQVIVCINYSGFTARVEIYSHRLMADLFYQRVIRAQREQARPSVQQKSAIPCPYCPSRLSKRLYEKEEQLLGHIKEAHEAQVVNISEIRELVKTRGERDAYAPQLLIPAFGYDSVLVSDCTCDVIANGSNHRKSLQLHGGVQSQTVLGIR